MLVLLFITHQTPIEAIYTFGMLRNRVGWRRASARWRTKNWRGSPRGHIENRWRYYWRISDACRCAAGWASPRRRTNKCWRYYGAHQTPVGAVYTFGMLRNRVG